MPVPPSQLLSDLGDRLLSQRPDGRFPLVGQWELTCRCNLKCRMCYTDPFNTPERLRQELTASEIILILTQLQEAGCLELTLTGGEPLARPDFPEIYTAAHQMGFLLTVFTNATLISDRIVDLWTNWPPRRIEISLHGITAETFERVTAVPGSFATCMSAIQRLSTLGIPIALKTTALTLNQDEILKIKKHVEALRPPVAFMLGEHLRDDLAASGEPYRYQLSEEDLHKLEQQDPQLRQEKEREIHEVQRTNGHCNAGRINFHIDAYGQLQLCSGNRRGGYDLRRGSFREGFFDVLPTLPCPNKVATPVLLEV